MKIDSNIVKRLEEQIDQPKHSYTKKRGQNLPCDFEDFFHGTSFFFDNSTGNIFGLHAAIQGLLAYFLEDELLKSPFRLISLNYP